MPTNEQELLKHHVQHAHDLIKEVEQQFEALRSELFSEQRRRLETEQSRDIIRAHAQAALEDYRAAKAKFEEFRLKVENLVTSAGMTGTGGALGDKLVDLINSQL